MEEVLVPIAVFFFCFGLPVAAWIVHTVLQHQERMEMLKRGIVPPPQMSRAQRRMWKYGLGMDEGAFNQQPVPPQPMPRMNYDRSAADVQLRKGITLAMIGLAIFIGLSFIDIGRPGPWLLGGLIPMFVGIAQIIIAILSGARFGMPYMAQPPQSGQQFEPGPPPGNGPIPRDVPAGPYGYRPGPTTELEPPTRPPDISR